MRVMDETALPLTDATLTALAQELLGRAATLDGGRRLLLGIAGIPGSGKSTLAERLAARLGEPAALVPMDGFHLTNAALEARGLRERKGAPETFDAEGYLALLRRFRDAAEHGPFPIYDRAVHEPVLPGDAAHRVDRRTRIVLSEGNYLLLDEPVWCELASVLDETWWLDTPVERARQWIMQRHRAVGRSPEEAARRYAHDARNVERVLGHRRAPDRVVRWPVEASEA